MLFSVGNKILLSVAISLLSFGFVTMTNADDSNSKRQELRVIPGQPTVFIDLKTQTASGIETIVTEHVLHSGEFEAIGKVISIQPLLALRERYLVAQAELTGAKSRLKQAGQSLKRQQALFDQGITARRSLQEQEASGTEDKAKVDAGAVRLSAIANEARLLWGDELSKWVSSENTSRFKDILSGKQQLLQVTLPANKLLADQINLIEIEPNGQRSKAFSAVLISRSTQVDSAIPGESYFFLVRDRSLPVGTKVSAWIPETTSEQAGVIVPESALIWYMDRIYAYTKVSGNTFARRQIKHFLVTPQGYFIDEDLSPGEEVVVTGAQQLLSEELRGQIPDED
jgi:hypothetical protein